MKLFICLLLILHFGNSMQSYGKSLSLNCHELFPESLSLSFLRSSSSSRHQTSGLVLAMKVAVLLGMSLLPQSLSCIVLYSGQRQTLASWKNGQVFRMCSRVCGAVLHWQLGVCDRPIQYRWDCKQPKDSGLLLSWKTLHLILHLRAALFSKLCLKGAPD